MASENLVQGLNHHKFIKSLHSFQSREDHLSGLPATEGINFNLFQVCVVFCVSILAGE